MTQQFDTPEESLFDGRGRYSLPDPVTGKKRSWQRVSTLVRMPSNTFGLEQWKRRNVVAGMALRPDLVAKAVGKNVSTATTTLNQIAEAAQEAAGSNAASDLGTLLHKLCEGIDAGEEPSGEHAERLAAYRDMNKQYGIKLPIELMERVTVSQAYGVGGRMDRIAVMPDGSRVIYDIKSGKSVERSHAEHATQLALYADGVNNSGLFNESTKQWEDPGFKVREDFGIIAHVPAAGGTCNLYRVDLGAGRRGADLAVMIRDWHGIKDVGERMETLQPHPEDWAMRIRYAESRDELVAIADEARAAGSWSQNLRELVLAKLPQVGG